MTHTYVFHQRKITKENFELQIFFSAILKQRVVSKFAVIIIRRQCTMRREIEGPSNHGVTPLLLADGRSAASRSDART